MMHHLDALAIANRRQFDLEEDAKVHRLSRAEPKSREKPKSEWSGAAVRRRPATI